MVSACFNGKQYALVWIKVCTHTISCKYYKATYPNAVGSSALVGSLLSERDDRPIGSFSRAEHPLVSGMHRRESSGSSEPVSHDPP